MIGLAALLDELHALGGELVVISGELRLIGDRSRVGADLRARLRERRAELLEHLRPHQCVTCGRHSVPVPGVVCFWCRRTTVDA